MSEDRGRVVASLRPKDHNLPKLSLNDFLTKARRYLHAFVSKQTYLHDLLTFFSNEQELWPDQGELFIIKLEAVQEPILELCTLLGKSTHLPVSVVPLRYPLIVALYHINEQINSTSALVNAYATSYRTSSKTRIRQHQEILRKISQIVSISEEILDLARILIDQSQFEERRLSQPRPG